MKQLHLFYDNRSENQVKNVDSLNLVGTQLKILRFFGILPPDKVNVTISAVTIFAYVIMFIAIFPTILQYWGNISMITVIIFQLAVVIDAFILRMYLMYNKSQLLTLFNMIDSHFMKFINNTVSSTNRATIIPKIKKQSKTFTRIFLVIFVAVIFSWGCLGYVKKAVHTSAGKITAGDDGQIYEYFSVVLWLPKDPLKSPVYEICYLYQVSCLLIVVGHYTASNIIFFFFIYYTAAHFELLLSCIEDLDNEFPKDEILVRSNYDHEEPKRINSLSEKQIPVSSRENSEYLKDNRTRWDLCDEPIPADNTNDISSKEKCKIEHLKECIKYHQALLEFSNKMTEFLSPMFLVYFLTSELMMCLAVFQLIVSEGNGIVKFITGVVNVCTWPLVISWCGEYLTAKSKAIEKAAYGCGWYNRSEKFKKLLHIELMRAQYPVKCTAGKFFAVSLESFADILNKVYAYFTIVKRMYES